jgi:hypothetical protein
MPIAGNLPMPQDQRHHRVWITVIVPVKQESDETFVGSAEKMRIFKNVSAACAHSNILQCDAVYQLSEAQLSPIRMIAVEKFIKMPTVWTNSRALPN